jgi:hypothetical protein
MMAALLKKQCCGYGFGIRCLFGPLDPGSGTRKKIRIRIRDEQPGSYFRELKKRFFGLKYLNFLMQIRDPGKKKFGFGMRNIRIRDPGLTSRIRNTVEMLAHLKKERRWRE